MSPRRSPSLDEIERYVSEAHGGHCLSTEYRGAHAKLEFMCPKHGTFEQSWTAIKHANRYCPKCGRSKPQSFTMQMLQEYANIERWATTLHAVAGGRKTIVAVCKGSCLARPG